MKGALKTRTVVETAAIVIIGIACGASVLVADPANAPNTQTQGGLKLTLASAKEKYGPGEQVQLKSTFENVGTTPISLTFWWNRRLRVTDAQGNSIPAGKGTERPCGAAESPVVLEPGKTLLREEVLECTQPAGVKEEVGWSYTLKPGTYRITLIFEAPPPHGYGRSRESTAWNGKLVSNEVIITIDR